MASLLRQCPLVLVLCVILAPEARPHPHSVPPPISFDLQIKDTAVDAFLMTDVPVIEMWQGGRRWTRPRDEESRKTALDTIVALVDRHVTVTIDGVRVPAEGAGVELFEAPVLEGLPPMNDVVAVTLRYPAHAPPETVHVHWNDFTGALWESEIQIPSLLETGTKVGAALFSPEEPDHTWHRRREAPKELGVTTLDAHPKADAVAAALGGGACTWIELALARPLRLGTRPNHAEAQAAFEAVLEHVTAALTEPDRAAALARLADVVHPTLVEALGDQLREPLILRERGGVLGRVQSIEPTGLDVRLSTAPWDPTFAVSGRWRLRVVARHHGHEHERRITLDARWILQEQAGVWKIRGFALFGRRLTDPDAEGNFEDLEDDR